MKKLFAAVVSRCRLGSPPRRQHESAGGEVVRSHVRRDDRRSSGCGEEGGGLGPAAVGRPVSGGRRRQGQRSGPVHARNGLGGKPARAFRPRQARAVRKGPRGQGHVSRHEARSRGARSGQREGARASRRGGASEAEPARAAHAAREGTRPHAVRGKDRRRFEGSGVLRLSRGQRHVRQDGAGLGQGGLGAVLRREERELHGFPLGVHGARARRGDSGALLDRLPAEARKGGLRSRLPLLGRVLGARARAGCRWTRRTPRRRKSP